MTEVPDARPRSPLSPYITAYMKREGLSMLKDFADRSGINRTTIYDLLRSPKNRRQNSVVSVPTLIALARTLDVPTHELLYLLVPDAPGSECFDAGNLERRTQEREQQRLRAVRDTLRQELSGKLPSTAEFLASRAEDHGEAS